MSVRKTVGRVSCRIPLELNAWLEAESARRGVSRSRLVNVALELYRTVGGIGVAISAVQGLEIPGGRPGRKNLLRAWRREQLRREQVQCEIDSERERFEDATARVPR